MLPVPAGMKNYGPDGKEPKVSLLRPRRKTKEPPKGAQP